MALAFPGFEDLSRKGGDRPRWGEQVEGVRAVEHLLKAGRREIKHLYLVKGAAGVVKSLAGLAGEVGVRPTEVDKGRIRQMAMTSVPQGVIAVCEPLPAVSVSDLARKAAKERGYLIAFDGVEDPANMGAALRTASALGAVGALIPEHGGAGLTPSAVKSAAGAVEYLDLAPVKSLAKALAQTSDAGLWSVILDSGGRSIYDQPLLTEPLVLVVGGEGRGVSRLVAERADLIASIPLSGKVESLNASAAVAAACSEICRIRGERA
ncbi:MAG: 23S rRNA (guanosine(2251)-2'-O)-methyltransferase RlmB [Acidobacteria bacterium]|nr:MAG: 23S rRNA (guanosine(2251)-2'-O)-methyltransferase RlmB [Acidobacteriota bacterium]